MIPIPATISVPLRIDSDGAIRVGHTRVLLELVIRAFNRGETPEGIVDSYPSLKLDDVYAVVTYYLQNKTEVDEYVRHVTEEGERIRQEMEAKQPEVMKLREQLRKHMTNKPHK